MQQRSISLRQQGITLVELMIALTLGLIIVAAAVQLFLSGQTSLNLQRGFSEVQDNANYGLKFLSYELRRANYGPSTAIHDRLPFGGIVLTTSDSPAVPATHPLGNNISRIPVNLPSRIGAALPVSGSGLITNVQIVEAAAGNTASSDQLVMQYYADRDGVDCEGRIYSAGRYIVQRFFLRKDANAQQDPHEGLALACEAGGYTPDSSQIFKNGSSATPTPFGSTNGAILMHRVDHFHILLGVSNPDNSAEKRYISIDNYKKINSYPRPRINSIQLGLLVRSSDSVGRSKLIPADQQFQVLDQTVRLKPLKQATPAKYLRQVIVQTVALRNGLGMADQVEGL